MFILIVLLLPQAHTLVDNNRTLEHELYNALLHNYNVNVVPRIDKNVIDVNISFTLMALMQFNEKEDTLVTAGWLSMTWKDYFLQWRGHTKYENINKVFMKQKQIWVPDINLVNSVEVHKKMGYDDLLASVDQDGTVHWEPGQKFKTACSVDIGMYPFDHQTCSIAFGTWMYRDDIVKLYSDYNEIVLDYFDESGEWEIQTTNAKDKIMALEDGYGVPQFVISMTLKRRRMYYIFTVCIPMIILSILNCMVYILPAGSGEKMSFCLTVLLSYMVFLNFLSDNLPRTSKTTSYMVVYLSLMVCLSFLSVFSSVIVLLHWHKAEEKEEHQINYERNFEGNIASQKDKLINSISNDNRTVDSNSESQRHFLSAAANETEQLAPSNNEKIAKRLDIVLFVSTGLLTITITIAIIILLLQA